MAKPNIFGSEGTNFVSFDELENAFKTPTQYQHFYEDPQRPSAAQAEFPDALVNPDGDSYEQLDDDDTQPDSHDQAMRTGERIARLVDSGIDFTLSNFVARNGESYRADERDLQDIAEAWGEMAEEKDWNIGPEWSLVILYLMVYGPLLKQALYDRRMVELEARQQQLEARMQKYENQQNADNDGTERTQAHPSPYRSEPAADTPDDD